MRHPNIVKFIDSFVDKKEQLMCILMDYCDGGDLSDLVQVREEEEGEGRERREGEKGGGEHHVLLCRNLA